MLFRVYRYFLAVISLSSNWIQYLYFYFRNSAENAGDFELHLRKKINIIVRPKSGDMIAVIEDFYDQQYTCFPLIFNKGGVVVDIGAHIGTFSLAISLKNPDLRIFCFEPQPQTFKQLVKNIGLNKHKDHFLVSQTALWTSNMKQKLYIAGGDSLGATLTKAISNDFTEVQCVTLNKLLGDYKINSCQLLKIDIEGAEYEVVESFTKSEYEKIESILVEYHVVDNPLHNKEFLCKILRKNNFEISLHPTKPIIFGKKS